MLRGKSFTESGGKDTPLRKIILKNHMNVLLKQNMYVAFVACRIKVLGYIEDLRSSYIFPEFLYLYQLTLHPSPNTPLIPIGYKPSRITALYLPLT
jgi:hypothetical protein